MLEYIDWLFFILILIPVLLFKVFADSTEGNLVDTAREEFIRNNGFEFEEIISRKRELQLHRHGFQFLISVDNEEKTNVSWKRNENEEVIIFDCEYVDKMSESGVKLYKTAVYFGFSNDSLYHFNLHPETTIEKLKQFLGNEDIDFDDLPTFSKNYSLRAENKETVIQNFPKELIEYIGSKKGVNIEARENCILIYDKSANDIELYELALSIKNILINSMGK